MTATGEAGMASALLADRVKEPTTPAMRVVCAWCKQEGRDALLGECEPVDDKTETHGICARHSKKLVEQLPSVSFPGIRVLFVVRRAETVLYDHLTRSFAALPDVTVMLDRRAGERRRSPGDVGIERRRTNRRIRKAQFSSLGYLVVRFGPEHEGRFTMDALGKLPASPRRLPE